MQQDHITLRLRHEKFVKKICDTNLVFALESEEGFATSSSNEYDDENDEPVQLILFWSEKALAKSVIKDFGEEYDVVEIPLSEFMENWCVGMGNDHLLIGTNFDQNMFGFEIDPYELILELAVELKTTNKDLEFVKFKNVADLESQIIQAKGD